MGRVVLPITSTAIIRRQLAEAGNHPLRLRALVLSIVAEIELGDGRHLAPLGDKCDAEIIPFPTRHSDVPGATSPRL